MGHQVSGVGLRALPETRGTGLNPEKALWVVSHLQFERGGGQKELPVTSVQGFQETVGLRQKPVIVD